MSNKIKKLCLSFALAAIVGVSAGTAGCTMQSDHPNAKITISFNNINYVIEYTLYRNMYPQTVQHFIELADSGFYNNTIIHDYSSSDWVGGGYSYNVYTDESGKTLTYEDAYKDSTMVEYLGFNSKEQSYYDLLTAGIKGGSFSASVYSRTIPTDNGETVSKDYALPTLIGEFSNNGHKIEDDKGLKAGYGKLKMVYYDKEGSQKVQLKNSHGQILYGDYGKNCATSLFAMQVGNSTSYGAANYCTFGQFKNSDAEKRFDNLKKAISDYYSDGKSPTTSFDVTVDKVDMRNDDMRNDGNGSESEKTFRIISLPIIIKTVEITKY